MSEIQSIPLHQLQISPRNARRTGGEDVDDLAASIVAENGLLQNLVVTDTGEGVFHVEAGGRRLRALQQLQRENRLPAMLTDGVPCRIVAADQSGEASLAENVIRVAMHPADAFAAYNDLFKAGKSVDTIAERFGVSTLHVRQRLRLANVAPDLVEAYRTSSDASLTLDCLQALALTDNHQQQRDAWATLRPSERNPTGIRTFLTRGKVRADSGIGAFVGLDAYVGARGNLERDLFSDTVYLLDRPLLDSLALDKLEAIAAQKRAEGWAWAEARLEIDRAELDEYKFLPGGYANVETVYANAEDEQRAHEIDQRLTEINDIDPDDLDAADRALLEDEYQALDNENDAISERMVEVFPAGTMKQSGVIVTLNYLGELQLHQPMLRPGETPAQAKKQAADTGGKATAPTAAPKPPTLSDAVLRTLSIHRSEVARVHIAEDFVLAQCLLIRQLLSDAHHQYHQTGLHVSGGINTPQAGLADLSPTLDARTDAIFDTINQANKLTLADLLKISDYERARLLAALVAGAFYAATDREDGHEGVDELHALIGFDMADHWTPATDDFLGRIAGPLVVEAVTEAKGKEAAATLNGLKKAERTAAAAKLLAGTGWLPKPLRGPGYGAAAKPAGKPQAKAKPAKKAAAKKKAPGKKTAKKPASKKPAAKKTAKA